MRNGKPQSDPRYDSTAIMQRPYANLVAGYYKSMPPEYRITRHAGTEDWLVILTIAGSGVIRRGTRMFPVRPNQILLFKPCFPHDYGTDPKIGHWGLVWAHFRPPSVWEPLLQWPELVPGMLWLDLSGNTKALRQITDGMKKMHRLATSDLPRRGWLAMNALEAVFLHCDSLASHSAENVDPRIPTLVNFIKNRISEPIALADLCKEAHLSTTQLSWLFRRDLKVSPQVYIEKQRMEEAARLLNLNSLSIKEVASRVGFCDSLYFSKRFKKHFGVCPVAYRRDLVNRLTL